MEKAVADGNRILAVLPNIGISSDGHGKSLWAPRKEGQVEAIRRAYGSNLDLSRIQYIEAHATSTNLGDITEIESLTEILREHLPVGAAIPMGGVKRNIGHTLEVAGVAGLLKVIVAMRHGWIPPAVDGSRPLNKDVDWESLPLYVNDQPIPWPPPGDGGPRRAGVNAFGIGGLNIHVVVDDFQPVQNTVVGGSSVSQQTQSVIPVDPDNRAVAIVGIGLVLPDAKDMRTFGELLHSGRSVMGPLPGDKWNPTLFSDPHFPGNRTISMPAAGVVRDFEYDWRKHRVPPKQLAQANPLQFMILDAVDQAFQQAGFDDERKFDRNRTGCIVGTEFGGDFSTQLLMGLRLPETCASVREVLQRHGVDAQTAGLLTEAFHTKVLEHFPALIDESGSFTASALASRITKSFNLMGGGVAVDADDKAAFAALTASVDMLLTDACDLMVCVAGQQSLLPEAFQVNQLSGRLAAAANTACPFDANANGTLMGEGCVALLLKRWTDARRDGDNVLGIIRGIGVARNEPQELAVEHAAKQALREAGIVADDVRGVASIGTGIAASDQAELDGLAAVYSRSSIAGAPLPLATPVGQFGNLAGTAGFVSLAVALLALDEEAMPATAACSTPTDSLRKSSIRLSAQSQHLSTSNSQGKLFVGLSGSPHTGNSYHVILQRGKPVKPQPVRPQFQSSSSWQTEVLPNGALLFDATIRRREKMRQAAADASRKDVAAKPRQVSPPVSTPARQVPNPVAAAPVSLPAPLNVQTSTPFAPVRQAHAPVTAPPPPQVEPSPAMITANLPTKPESTSALAPAEVETFLINFVMEQTGYPREIVELDADLEADLGIDSIKKAQLFGELGEYFDVPASSDLSLDAFPTLRTVMEFLLQHATAAEVASTQTAVPTSAPVVAPAPAPAAIQPPTPSPAAATAPPASAPSTSEPSTSAPSTSALAPAEVEEFLINFVMEQTGYPQEIVELDADLEADLGIDSIKKAQLFGELGEYFDVQASSDLSLDAFPTLRTVMAFLLQNATAAEVAPAQTAVPTSAPVVTPAPVPAGIQRPTPSPAAATSPPTGSTPASAPPTSALATSALAPAEVEAFLINFVMEQTGYPQEIVELDADLEADLGIDSIKKAQLFGELGEYFDVQASSDMSLDAFPTLRTVMEFLLRNAATHAPSAASVEVPATSPTSPSSLSSSAAVDPAEVEAFIINLVMDRTGYPREVVDLDGDLEADLGIDDIKKAELLAHIGARFGVPDLTDLPASEFPTLRKALAYVVRNRPANPNPIQPR